MVAMPEPEASEPEAGQPEAPGPEGVSEAAQDPAPTWPEVDRRRTPDRRRRPTSFWDTLVGPRRRRSGRRREDHRRLYVDVYHPTDVVLVLAVFLLNLADAFFTLTTLSRGGTEENPLMARLLEAGDSTFLFEKCFVVGFWLVLLIVHKNFRLARIGLWLLLVAYTGLFGWHVLLHFTSFGGG